MIRICTSILVQAIDYLWSKSNFAKILELEFKLGQLFTFYMVYANSIFTNGFKMETSTGSGIFFDNLYISVSLKLLNTCTALQVANYAINITAKRLYQFSFLCVHRLLIASQTLRHWIRMSVKLTLYNHEISWYTLQDIMT